ncbi:hypothetical protein HKK80_10035 [Halonotius sp. F2-221B]|uniref:hypothetical protein n=1 Tax=Halonotius sp. F2-221B TaxID=2731620 RepID=UPI00398B3DCC
MDSNEYRDHVETQVLDHEYDPLPPEEANPFDPVWYKEDEDPTIGRTKVFITINDDLDLDTETLKTTTESFRTLVGSASPPTDGSFQNLFGYIVYPRAGFDEALIEFATEEFTVANRRTNVFPLLYDLDAETLHTHTIPRLKGRGFYEKQKFDAEELLTPHSE